MRRWALALAPFIAAHSGTARADDLPVALVWNVPAGERCPPADEVLRQVARLVGSTPSPERSSIRAQADVRKLSDDRFRLDLTTISDGSEGHRVIEERSCAAMAEATAVILAWMVDPDAVDASSSAAQPVPEAPDGAQKSKPEADDQRPRESTPEDRGTAPAPPRQAPRATNLVLGVAAVFDSSTLPAFAAGFGLELGARWTALRILARGALWANQTARVAQGAKAAGAELGFTTLGIDACVAPWRWDIAPCAGPELDRMQGTGFGVDNPRTNSASWISLGLGIEGRVGLVGPVGVTLGLRLVVPTRRETFGLDGVGAVHRVGALAGRGALGLDAIF